jgi:hypothetical protein
MGIVPLQLLKELLEPVFFNLFHICTYPIDLLFFFFCLNPVSHVDSQRIASALSNPSGSSNRLEEGQKSLSQSGGGFSHKEDIDPKPRHRR